MRDLIVEFDLDPLQDLLDTLDWSSPQLQCVAHVPPSSQEPASSERTASESQDSQLIATPTSPISPGKRHFHLTINILLYFIVVANVRVSSIIYLKYCDFVSKRQ